MRPSLVRALLSVTVAGLVFVLNDCPSRAEDWPALEELPAQAGLPSAMTSISGHEVKTLKVWDVRREELKSLFQHYVYGYLPPEPAFAERKLIKQVKILDGAAELIEVDYVVGPTADRTVTLHVAIFRPTAAQRPAPVFIALNKCGNHEVLAAPEITRHEVPWVHSGCKDSQRGEQTDYWCVPALIERGYAFVTCHVDDIDPDRDDFTDGVHPLYEDWFEAENIPAEHRWGTLAAWAWGLHRLVDVIEQTPALDAERIGVIGHSRRGKAALFAAAMDGRIALAVPHQSGTGGMALSRENDQETVERITRVFPHWFNRQFARFGGQEAKLPVDQHLLIALVAPRPLLETSGLQDTWANFNSSFRAIEAADAVYRFHDVVGLRAPRPLTADDPINASTTGRLAQYRLDTKHVLTREYWLGILDFADLHFRD